MALTLVDVGLAPGPRKSLGAVALERSRRVDADAIVLARRS